MYNYLKWQALPLLKKEPVNGLLYYLGVYIGNEVHPLVFFFLLLSSGSVNDVRANIKDIPSSNVCSATTSEKQSVKTATAFCVRAPLSRKKNYV